MKYYINSKSTNNPHHDQEVHKEDCCWMPSPGNREFLGYFSNGVQAVQEAKKLGYADADGCAVCCPEAHRQ